MEMTGHQTVLLSQQRTWDALNDVSMLKHCIPGCDKLEQVAENQFQLTMTSRIGPVSAKFKGLMTLQDIDVPRAYTVVFEGQGGVVGFAKGQAAVTLTPGDQSTVLEYTVKAMIGGKLAQLGARLIDGVARKLADDFFTCFNTRASTLVPGQTDPDLSLVSRTSDCR